MHQRTKSYELIKFIFRNVHFINTHNEPVPMHRLWYMHTTHNYIWKDCHLWHHESRVWPLRHHLVKVPWLQPLRLREAMTCSSLRLWPQTTDNACQLYPTLGQSSIKVPRGECSLTVHTSLSLPTDHWRTVEWRSVQWTSKFSGNVDKIKFGTRFAHILTFWYPKNRFSAI